MLNINIDGYQQISKAKARRLYNDGATVYLCAAKMRPGATYWSMSANVNSKNGYDFTKLCNSYQFYNCSSETGRYIRYYVKESE